MCIEFLIQVSKQKNAHVFFLLGGVRNITALTTHAPFSKGVSLDWVLGRGQDWVTHPTGKKGISFANSTCKKVRKQKQPCEVDLCLFEWVFSEGLQTFFLRNKKKSIFGNRGCLFSRIQGPPIHTVPKTPPRQQKKLPRS